MKHPNQRTRSQRGFALVSAIFLLVVLGLLGGLMVSMSNSQQMSAVRDVLGTRAYYAARAGIEWGAYQALQGGGNCPLIPTALPNAVAATDFAVQVQCNRFNAPNEAGVPVTLYQITATASTGTPGAHDHAERQLQAVVSAP
jgi:MSHA biogenesis protein MshP